jgi:hypothetical protein
MYLDLDDQTRAWIADNKDRRWALLLEYWNWLAQQVGRLPRRAEIDATQLPPQLLPNIFLVDVVDSDAGPRFRFRLLGAAIAARETIKPGQFLDDYEGAIPDAMRAQYLACMERRVSIRRSNLAWDHPTKEFISYHVMLLPLSSDGSTVDTILGLAIYEA